MDIKLIREGFGVIVRYVVMLSHLFVGHMWVLRTRLRAQSLVGFANAYGITAHEHGIRSDQTTQPRLLLRCFHQRNSAQRFWAKPPLAIIPLSYMRSVVEVDPEEKSRASPSDTSSPPNTIIRYSKAPLSAIQEPPTNVPLFVTCRPRP